MNCFRCDISHGQLSVFRAGLDRPYNDWSEDHVKQGFAWRSESVSFSALEDGETLVSILLSDNVGNEEGLVRSIEVPFEVPENGLLEIGSIFETKQIEIKTGLYALCYQTGYDSSGQVWMTLTFIPRTRRESTMTARIIKCDSELSPAFPLMMSAKPA